MRSIHMRSTHLLAPGLGLGLLLGLATAAVSQDDATLKARAVDDPSRPKTYVGFYRIASGENDGEPLPPEAVAGHVVRITDAMITVLDADENTLYACKYTLKPGEGDRPDRLDMETAGGPNPDAVGRTARGIIRTGNNDEGRPFVMLCYRTIGDDYPEEFGTRAETQTNLFVLEAIPDPAAADVGAGAARTAASEPPPPDNPPEE